MRIISGDLKGQRILPPENKSTRPLRDLVKESIFNLLKHSKKIKIKLENSEVLDLFSGSGSFGLECISRGSKNVIFIENYARAIKILKENIEKLKVEKKSDIIESDVFKIFDKELFLNKKFDLIFLDPPYKEENINVLLKTIKTKQILKENGLMVVHRHKKDSVKITNSFKILDKRIYGISKLIIGY